jgi:hypothetical protein
MHVPPTMACNAVRIVNHKLGNKGAFAVAGFIETARTLVIVDIQRNGITPEGITRIAEAMSGNKTIQSLECVPPDFLSVVMLCLCCGVFPWPSWLACGAPGLV